MLRVTKKAVLLHPLSEGTRGETRGVPEGEFFESLRPAQDQRRCGSGARQGTFRKGTPKRTSRRNPRFRVKQEKQ